MGLLSALGAGLMWGLVFMCPLLLPDYPAVLQSFGRYLAFGLIALPLAWMDRHELRQYTRQDWLLALELALVGNLLYYVFLASAIQRTGAVLVGVIIGTLPVVIAVANQLRQPHTRLPWGRLWPSLVLMAAGIACVNQHELALVFAQTGAGGAGAGRYGWGIVLALAAVVCWTWYPLRNADWLRTHTQRVPRAWASAQGLATLPLAALGFVGYGLWMLGFGSEASQAHGFLGPTPWRYVLLMLALGFCASWLGTLLWSDASQRLPTTLVGMLIVFETLAAVGFALLLRQQWPSAWTLGGVLLLVGGVVLAVYRMQRPTNRPSERPANPVH
nr:DMT family transporter [Curvibacter sp. CHRR-16]